MSKQDAVSSTETPNTHTLEGEQKWQTLTNYDKREREADGDVITATSPVSQRPSFPTHEEIIFETEKIYKFVQNKD